MKTWVCCLNLFHLFGINLDISYISTKEMSFLIPYTVYSNQPYADVSSSKNILLISLGIRVNNR